MYGNRLEQIFQLFQEHSKDGGPSSRSSANISQAKRSLSAM